MSLGVRHKHSVRYTPLNTVTNTIHMGEFLRVGTMEPDCTGSNPNCSPSSEVILSGRFNTALTSAFVKCGKQEPLAYRAASIIELMLIGQLEQYLAYGKCLISVSECHSVPVKRMMQALC